MTVHGTVLHPQRLNVHQLVAGAIETAGALAAEHGQQLTLREDGEVGDIEGDPIPLRQALSNLLQNAIRYTPDGGRIDVILSDAGERTVISVRDNGEGIPSERLEAIFDPFVRLSGAGPGLGIGLALVRRIVELHGGTVTAASDGPGCGSVFTVSLPREAADQHARA